MQLHVNFIPKIFNNFLFPFGRGFDRRTAEEILFLDKERRATLIGNAFFAMQGLPPIQSSPIYPVGNIQGVWSAINVVLRQNGRMGRILSKQKIITSVSSVFHPLRDRPGHSRLARHTVPFPV